MIDKIMQKVYMDAQDACGLKVGDYVKVIRQPADHEAGWPCYAPSTDNTGRTGKVREITSISICVDFPDDIRCYPYFVLEKVEKPAHEFKPFEKVLVRGTLDSLWKCNYFSTMKNVNNKKIYNCIWASWNYCIPYEGNEHLLNTTDSPDA